MICPTLGGPVFVVRLIPIYSLSAQLIYDEAKEILHIVNENNGTAFLLMTDNYRVNISNFNMFHDAFKSLNSYSIEHPIANSDFKCFYLMYDIVHIIKNIRNNWQTEKNAKAPFL